MAADSQAKRGVVAPDGAQTPTGAADVVAGPAPPVALPGASTPVLAGLWRRATEYRRFGQDPVLLASLLAVGLFLLLFVVWPLARVIGQGVYTEGAWSIEQYGRYFDDMTARYYRNVVWDTLVMGVLTGTGGTALGFMFAYAVARCAIPGKRVVHVLALLPTISPPFAIAIAAILLFGRNGLITARLLGIDFGPGVNDIYGMDGLVFVQVITFFSVAYLILRGMLERLDPAFEEAAESLGASKWHIFRTVTLPLLIPGFASAFLLLFVEALADLGNPLLIAGNTTVLSTQIWMAVTGEYDQKKAAALSVVLLIPTLTVFILQRYWVSRRSYVSVTGKPTGGAAQSHDPRIRWLFNGLTYVACGLIILLYGVIVFGSLTRVWGVDYSLDLTHYAQAINRGLKAILDTTFLSAVATPIAGILGMVAAWIIVRRSFSGREALDFTSTLGGAVPGTILGIGYIIAFITAPMLVVTLTYLILLLVIAGVSARRWPARLGIVAVGLGIGFLVTYIPLFVEEGVWRGVLALLWIGLALLAWALSRRAGHVPRGLFVALAGLGVYIWLGGAIQAVIVPLAAWGRTLPGPHLPKIVDSLAQHIGVFFQAPVALLGVVYGIIAVVLVTRMRGAARWLVAAGSLALIYAMMFVGEPFVLIGTPYIILAAYAVRSPPASVRAGTAQLQQIDPAIEEASTSLGADASITFRRITLPLILPAFLAGLIFAFARHMTSLSAIIFLTTPKWPILTALILSEVEQGGMSLAAAYSVILILIVLAAIGLMYLLLGRPGPGRDSGDLSIGVG